MKIEDWKRPPDWKEYPEMENEIWEIKHLKNLCLVLERKTEFDFDIYLDDSTCIHVFVKKDMKTKAECFVNRGDTEAPIFSIYCGEDEHEYHEYHGSNMDEIHRLIISSRGYFV